MGVVQEEHLFLGRYLIHVLFLVINSLFVHLLPLELDMIIHIKLLVWPSATTHDT